MTTEDKKVEEKDKVEAPVTEMSTSTEPSDNSDHLIWDRMQNVPFRP